MNTRFLNISALSSLMAAGLALVMTGCHSDSAKEIVEIPNQYSAKMADERETTGMKEGWMDYEQIKKYDSIMVNAKVSDKMLSNSWWDDFSSRRWVATKDEDNAYVANYTKDSLINAFKESKNLKLVEKPGPKTLKLDFFVVQVVPNKPVMGGMSNITTLSPIGLMLLPLKMGMRSASGSGGGAIAMETILSDSENNNILAVFASREKEPTSLFSTKDFTGYGTVRSIVKIWSKDLVETLDQIKEGKTEISTDQKVKGFKWVQ